MTNSTLTHFKLQDGTYFPFNRSRKNEYITMYRCLQGIEDKRNPSGLRHPLASILFIVFSGMLSGKTTIKDIQAWAVANQLWLRKVIPLAYGIADATTISRCLAMQDVQEVTRAWQLFVSLPYDKKIASVDGKCMCGVRQGETRHILSLFSHQLTILAQEGVVDKENEIPAFIRLLDHTFVRGMLLVSDALHTQTNTAAHILDEGAHYLMQVKKNQKTLHEWLEQLFMKQPVATYSFGHDDHHGRQISVLCLAITDGLTCSLFHSDWIGLQTLIALHRYGTRNGKPVDEQVYAISSKKLSATDAADILRAHWCIENNLHWRKDVTYREDKQRAVKGASILTFLRSMTISVMQSAHFASFTDALLGLQLYPQAYRNFLKCMNII